MTTRRFGAASFAGVLCALLAGCNGDGSPSGAPTFDVNGSWVEVSTLVSNTCPSELDPPPTSSIEVTIIQGTNQITFVFLDAGGNITVMGSFNAQTGEFVLSLTFQEGGDTLRITQSGRFTSNSRYTSESSFVFTGSLTCMVTFTEVGVRR